MGVMNIITKISKYAKLLNNSKMGLHYICLI